VCQNQRPAVPLRSHRVIGNVFDDVNAQRASFDSLLHTTDLLTVNKKSRHNIHPGVFCCGGAMLSKDEGRRRANGGLTAGTGEGTNDRIGTAEGTAEGTTKGTTEGNKRMKERSE